MYPMHLKMDSFRSRKLLNVADFKRGFQQGLPIAFGYIPVSFTFGLMAVNGGQWRYTGLDCDSGLIDQSYIRGAICRSGIDHRRRFPD